MMFSINSTSGTPIYMQIVEQVRQYVVSGHLKAEELLPSVRTVAQGCSINPMTVSRAYSMLHAEGVVEKVRGKGMKVSKTSVNPHAAIRPQIVALVATVRRLRLSPADIAAVVDQVWSEPEKHNELDVDEGEAVSADLGATS